MVKVINSNRQTILLNNLDLTESLKDSVIARDLPEIADIDSSLYLSCKDIRKDFVIALSGECADELFGGYPWYANEDMIYSHTFPWSRHVSDRNYILNDSFHNLDIEGVTKYHYEKSLLDVPHQYG